MKKSIAFFALAFCLSNYASAQIDSNRTMNDTSAMRKQQPLDPAKSKTPPNKMNKKDSALINDRNNPNRSTDKKEPQRK